MEYKCQRDCKRKKFQFVWYLLKVDLSGLGIDLLKSCWRASVHKNLMKFMRYKVTTFLFYIRPWLHESLDVPS